MTQAAGFVARQPEDPRGTYKIEKQSYSRGAWRVLNAAGEQVYRNEIFDHPMLGPIPIAGPVCFDRKRDAVAWVENERQLIKEAL